MDEFVRWADEALDDRRSALNRIFYRLVGAGVFPNSAAERERAGARRLEGMAKLRHSIVGRETSRAVWSNFLIPFGTFSSRLPRMVKRPRR
jgi:hypothetical protein